MAVQGAPADLITGVAAPLPLAVLCHLVGIPLADRETGAEGIARFLVTP